MLKYIDIGKRGITEKYKEDDAYYVPSNYIINQMN